MLLTTLDGSSGTTERALSLVPDLGEAAQFTGGKFNAHCFCEAQVA
jgi:hypothetical protein